MAPHVVTITRNTQGTEEDGGRRVASATTATSLRCFVQPGLARTIIDTSDATGNSRVTEFNPTRIYFLDDVGISVQDLISWVDHAGVTHTYQVVGYIAPAAPFAQWRAECQEKI
jgi:hypothetical protein